MISCSKRGDCSKNLAGVGIGLEGPARGFEAEVGDCTAECAELRKGEARRLGGALGDSRHFIFEESAEGNAARLK
jgi:hypothetical protein